MRVRRHQNGLCAESGTEQRSAPGIWADYVDSKTLEEYGQRQRNCNLEDMDMDSLRRVSDALGIPTDEPLAPVLERFRKATQREPLYQCIFHEDDGSLTESYGLMFE